MKEAIAVTLLGWIPFEVGRVLRRYLYQSLCPQVGRGVQIQPQVELINTSQIRIGNLVKIDRYVRIRSVDRQSRVILGDRLMLHQGVDIRVHSGSGTFEIGEQTTIGLYSTLSGLNLKIGKNCLIGPHIGMFANSHIYEDPTCTIREQRHSYKGITIGDDCWMGKGVTGVDRVTIGDGCVIGAGAVITKDLPPIPLQAEFPPKSCPSEEQINPNSQC